jgi:hypothetical protein
MVPGELFPTLHWMAWRMDMVPGELFPTLHWMAWRMDAWMHGTL